MASCYEVDFGEGVARVHGEPTTDPETIEAIQAVCKAVYKRLKEPPECDESSSPSVP